jgi:hypothetical protein
MARTAGAGFAASFRACLASSAACRRALAPAHCGPHYDAFRVFRDRSPEKGWRFPSIQALYKCSSSLKIAPKTPNASCRKGMGHAFWIQKRWRFGRAVAKVGHAEQKHLLLGELCANPRPRVQHPRARLRSRRRGRRRLSRRGGAGPVDRVRSHRRFRNRGTEYVSDLWYEVDERWYNVTMRPSPTC